MVQMGFSPVRQFILAKIQAAILAVRSMEIQVKEGYSSVYGTANVQKQTQLSPAAQTVANQIVHGASASIHFPSHRIATAIALTVGCIPVGTIHLARNALCH
jgi:hypothetical protein